VAVASLELSLVEWRPLFLCVPAEGLLLLSGAGSSGFSVVGEACRRGEEAGLAPECVLPLGDCPRSADELRLERDGLALAPAVAGEALAEAPVAVDALACGEAAGDALAPGLMAGEAAAVA
jgi:hypothetical protein